MDKPTTASELAAALQSVSPDTENTASAHNAIAAIVSFYAAALQRARVREEHLQRQLALANQRAGLLLGEVEKFEKERRAAEDLKKYPEKPF